MKESANPTHQTGRRRKSNATAALAVAGLLASAAFVAWTALRREKDVYLTKEVNTSFDLQEAPESPAAPRAPAPAPIPAPAPPSSLIVPIAIESMAKAPAPGPAGRRPPVVTAKVERWALTHRVFAAFLKAPTRMLTGRSSRMGSPRAFVAFLADPKQVDAYLDSPLVRIALNSPTVTKALLVDAGVVKAFLGTPAMQDPAAVKALMSSKLLEKVLDCPGPQGVLEDPAALTAVVTNPATVKWLGENPDALKAVTRAAPELGAALSPKPKKRR